MEREQLVMQYRELDRDIALFYRKFSGSGRADWLHLVPNLENKKALQAELAALQARADALVTPEPVFEIMKKQMTDALKASVVRLEAVFSKPHLTVTEIAHLAQFAYREFSTNDEEKARRFIACAEFLPTVWEAVLEWIDDVPVENLRPFPVVCRVSVENIKYHVEHLAEEYAHMNPWFMKTVSEALLSACEKLTEYAAWVEEKYLKDDPGKQEQNDDAIIKLDEDYYRTVLWDSLGVSFDAILSWHEQEIEKTRARMFSIARSLPVPEAKDVKTAADVNAILLKYAGPCDNIYDLYRKGVEYLDRARKEAYNYIWLPEGVYCTCQVTPYEWRFSWPWGGSEGCDPGTDPLTGAMILNKYNYKNITDGWIKMNAVHESFPGHFCQGVRSITDTLPETMKMPGVRSTPLIEGTAHRSETLFEFIYPEDPFYPLFTAYRQHHTAVRIKADLMLRYFGRPIRDAVKLYMDELDYDYTTARGQVKQQEDMEGYFTTYYFGYKKIRELEEQYKDVYDEKQFTEILFAVGRVSVDILEMYLALPEDQKRSYRYDFKSLLMTREFPAH